MPESVDVLAFGCPWRVDLRELPDAERAALAHAWSRCDPAVLRPDGVPVPGEDPAVRTMRVTRDSASITPSDLPERDKVAFVSTDPARVSYDLSRALTRASIARQTGFALMVHAAGLAELRSGRAVMLAGPTGTGKSTASRRLGQVMGYLSDETVAVTDDLRVLPWPKPPSLIPDGEQRWVKDEPSPDDLGLGPTLPEAELGAVVVLARDGEPGRPVLEPLGVIEACLAIIPETSGIASLPAPLARLAAAVTHGAGAFRLRYAEIEDCVSLITTLPERRSLGVDWAHLPPPAGSWPGWLDDAPASSGEAERGEAERRDATRPVVRRRYRDAIGTDEGILVLVGSTPVHLDGLAGLVWELAESAVSVEALFAAVVGQIGPAPGAREVFDTTLDLLWERGMLVHPAPGYPVPVALQPMRGVLA
ncbi:hypothetical protein [Kribbia dieselivorans]|uniref:hypothetical protein n=1 Tax=Kribbia dieselivorans TaxID=331526 RepID=UPI000A5AD3D9|nr:hypothetical protein [Kribbia dieselivorans]